jgi:hypothetical protein
MAATLRGVHEKKVSVAVEGTYGVLGTYARAIPCDLKADYKYDSVLKTNMGQARMDAFAYKREGVLSGNIAMTPNTDDMGEILLAFFGTRSTVGAGGTHVHTFTPVGTIADSFPSLSVQCNYGQATCYDYTGVRIDKLSLSVAAKEEFKLSADFIGQYESVGTGVASTYSSLMPMNFGQVTMYLDGTAYNQGVRNLAIELNNYLSDGFRIGTWGNTRRPLPGQKMTGLVKYDLDFQNETARTRYLTGSYIAVKFVLEGEAYSGTHKQTLEINMPKITYQSAPFDTFDGYLGLTCTGYILDGTNSNGTGAVIATLHNAVATY